MTDVLTTCAVVIFRLKVSSITSVEGIKTLFIDVIGQFSRDSIGRLLVKPLSTPVLFRTTFTRSIIRNVVIIVVTVIRCFNSRKALLC